MGAQSVLCRALFGVSLTLVAASVKAQPRDPDPAIHREFPVQGRENLSPPIVAKPIHQCALAVFVSGAVPHAEVNVFANGSELVGTKKLWIGSGEVPLTRPLKVNDVVTATQVVNGVKSLPSIQPVTVTSIAASALGKPDVSQDLWSCGIVVPVGKLTPSARVNVFENGQLVGSGNAAGEWLPVVTQALTAGRAVQAQQLMCPDDPALRIEGPMSDPPGVTVKASPTPPPAPAVIPGSVVPGKDTVDVTGLFTGAEVIVRDRGNVVASGMFATGSSNWVPIQPPAEAASKVDAAQKLCTPSPFSPPVDPVTELRTPVLAGPICDRQQFVVIQQTMLGAYVVVRSNGAIVGYGGGNGGTLVLGLSRELRASPQDHVSVRQYYGSLISTQSNTVDVVAGITAPSISIEGGEPFFLPERGEEAIDAPVFPRGRGPGPRFAIQTCCRDRVRAEILAPNGVAIATLPLVEAFPGYFTATWDWKSTTHWTVPSGIPPGAFTVRVTTGCRQEPASAKFYVIFDPNEVAGPPRFSFDETNIWFYSPANSDRALTYALHPDDRRIFEKAINAASGEPSALAAAKKVAIAESNLFAYSISKSDDDTLELLQDTLAQCADDAAMLTAMLRGIGIPAHTATADAAAETGFDWSFDTWTEFLVPGSGGPVWKVVHPHWPANGTVVGPDDRTPFGNNVGVAKKAANDIVFAAGPAWAWNEVNDTQVVSFSRQACGEPNQSITKKAWVDELCEAGYWAPRTHWECGVGSSSSGLSIAPDFRVDARGGRIEGEVTIRSGERATRGAYRLELVADVPETKVFGDRVLAEQDAPLRLDAAASKTTRFAFTVAEPLRPGETLLLRLVKGRRTIAAIDLPIRPNLRLDSEREKSLVLGRQDELVVRVRGADGDVARSVRMTVDGPSAIDVGTAEYDERATAANGLPTYRIRLTGRAPLDAGTLRIFVTSTAGPATISVPVRVVGAPSGDTPPDGAVARRR